jgi:hypothetical protein
MKWVLQCEGSIFAGKGIFLLNLIISVTDRILVQPSLGDDFKKIQNVNPYISIIIKNRGMKIKINIGLVTKD